MTVDQFWLRSSNSLSQIVSNTEVWDVRTFHLLKTVPVLNQRTAVFSPANSAIYAISMEQELDDGDSTFDTSFKTVDAIDYSSIATIDVKKNIYDLAVNKFDTQIVVVENQGVYQSVQESVVRIYDVGRKRDDEDEQVSHEFAKVAVLRRFFRTKRTTTMMTTTWTAATTTVRIMTVKRNLCVDNYVCFCS
jgi:hypothetical protein